MTHPTVVLYARRSMDRDDAQVLSIEQQINALRRLAVQRKIEIAEELTESASAKDPGRPVFGEILKRIRHGKVDGLLVWKLDRLARNMVDGGELIFHLSKGHLKEIVTPEATYTSTGDSKFMLAMLFGAAAKYTDDLSLAVRRGNEDALRRGKVPGPVPLGYLKTHDHERGRGAGTVIPDPERFETMKRIWQEVVRGETNIRKLWDRARSEWGLTMRPTRGTLARPVGLGNLYGLLRNPFYAGRISHGGVIYKGEHPPMVTVEQFEEAQRRLGRNGAKGDPRAHHDLLYRGLLVCGDCGRHYVGEEHRKNSHVYRYYRCDRRKPGSYVCPSHEVREQDVTESIARALDSVTIDPAIRDWAREAVAWWRNENDVEPETLVRRAKAALARAEHELVTLTDLVVQAFISEQEYLVRRTNQLHKIAHLRETLAEPAEKLEAERALQDEKKRNGLKLGIDFRNGDAVIKRKLLSRTVEEIVMVEGKPMLKLRTPFVMRPLVLNVQPGLDRVKTTEA